jgi:outer membrane protein assembly factor BamB
MIHGFRFPVVSVSLLTLLPLLPLGPRLPAAPNWAQFRGPGARGVAEGSENPPAEWSTNRHVVWKTPLPGRGWSSPIVWGERLFLTTAVNEGKEEVPKKGLYLGGNRTEPVPYKHRWIVFCLDCQNGNVLWQRVAHDGLPASSHHIKNTYASETPVTDGERVYAYFGNLGLFVYDLEGKQLWKRNWGSFKTRYGWGTAASPVLDGDRIYILNDNEERSFLVALDKKTGEQLWRVERDEKSNWATPFVWTTPQRTEIVTSGTGKVRSYDRQGELLWELRGMSSITIPTPFSAHGLLYIASGFVIDRQRPIYAIRPGAAGDVSLETGSKRSRHIAWCQPLAAPYNPSTIVYGDLHYVLHDRGFVASYDARTGKEIYGKQRLNPEANGFTASPWAYDGKIFCLSEDGDTFVVQAGPDFKVLGVNRLEEMCMATPAIAGGSLFIRTLSKIYRIAQAGDSE